MKNSLPTKAQRAVELATENEGIIKLADRDSPNYIKELDCNLKKKEFRDAMKLRTTEKYQFVQFSVDQAMVCQRGGFIIQRHNELRDLEVEMLGMVCNDVEL